MKEIKTVKDMNDLIFVMLQMVKEGRNLPEVGRQLRIMERTREDKAKRILIQRRKNAK